MHIRNHATTGQAGKRWRRALVAVIGLAAVAIPTMSVVGATAANAATPDLIYATVASGYPANCYSQGSAFYQQTTDSIWMDVNVSNSNWFSACRVQAQLWVDTVFGSWQAGTISAPTACPIFDFTCGHYQDSGWQFVPPLPSFVIDYGWLRQFALRTHQSIQNLIYGVHVVIAPR